MKTGRYEFSVKVRQAIINPSEVIEVEIDESWSEHQEAVAVIKAYESWLDTILEYGFKKAK